MYYKGNPISYIFPFLYSYLHEINKKIVHTVNRKGFFLISGRLEREMKLTFEICLPHISMTLKNRVKTKSVLSMVSRNYVFNKIGSMGQDSRDFFHKILERKKRSTFLCQRVLVFGFVL